MLNKRSFLAVLFLLVLTACSSERNRQYFGTDITGIDFARGFSLTSHEGKLVRSEDFKGKLVVLFFGFTYCPEVCPTTLSEFAVALEKMGEEKASEIQVLFVTIDPQRDDKNRLKNYFSLKSAEYLILNYFCC